MGKRIKELRRSNQGSTLILVLFCMTFLGLLGSVVLTATVSNMRMKAVDSIAQGNFYTAESAVDEFKVGLDEISQACMKEAYTYMLQSYSTTPDSERPKLLMRKFVNLLYEDLTGVAPDNSEIEQDADVNADTLLSSYLLSDTGKKATTVSGSSIKVVKNLDDLTVTLKGVSISYTDSLGYQSTITTDIRVAATYPKIASHSSTKAGVYFTDYGIIADGLILLETNSTTVKGNVYGGMGIQADGATSHLTLYSDKVITREGLIASNKGTISIPGPASGSAITNSVWVKNMETYSTLPTSSATSYLDIVANCYVQDDLTLGANYGAVKLKGNYYGYQIDTGVGSIPNFPADGSSSIVINARNAELDMSQLQNLWLSGKSYLNIPSLYGSSVTLGAQLRTGESISFKGSQVAYLVPGKCISDIGHNPMTPTEFDTIKDIPGYGIIIDDASLTGGINVSGFVDSTNPSTARHVNFLNEDTKMQMVYLYWNFSSTDSADKYFREYQVKYNAKLGDLADTMELGNVYLPSSYDMLVNSGNVLSYESDALAFSSSGMHPKNSSVTDITDATVQTKLSDKKMEFATKSMGLWNYLKEDRFASDLSDSLVKNLIRFESEDDIDGIILDADKVPSGDDVFCKVTSGGNFILVTTNEVDLKGVDSGKKGLIITNKNVKLTDCEFTGLIITTGNITLSHNSKINADSDLVKSIIYSTPEVSQYFKDYNGITETTDGEASSVRIAYENWYKE